MKMPFAERAQKIPRAPLGCHRIRGFAKAVKMDPLELFTRLVRIY